MAYDLGRLAISSFSKPAFRAGIALTRLDERVSHSEVGSGFFERQNFADTCASL
jgi:hypothetical protein